ncbi:related to GIT1 - Glycerophosphoinositol transporter also able to mediate low-affinity phosphate transport [Pseudozyma flocculosa]|uniref:Related to GIT1 - Glycerophosphoinositol transporter also able to mediate low-affinity phosphate transport n=1 Tax=Pseudozyma flocculosa TaxID=84751 RepID=A0A5C3FCX9_9BASI|nr:related to GIT1 - Glycerophosphoinositol transporter also able to mediate low-affinity phosphate transport [Pseudozyma flocculosa]
MSQVAHLDRLPASAEIQADAEHEHDTKLSASSSSTPSQENDASKPEHQATATATAPAPPSASRWMVVAAGAALIADGYHNNLMTMANSLFKIRYGAKEYNSDVSTRISNALLVGAVLGQLSVGVICDRLGRKTAVTATTLLLVVGAIFATAATPVHGSLSALFWWLTVARGAIGVGVGGEYPASSTSASEAANERFKPQSRSRVFILVTNLLLSLGGPFAVSVFLIVLSASGYSYHPGPGVPPATPDDMRRLDIIWRVCFGFGCLPPLIIFAFRWRMLNSNLYRKNAIRKRVPYLLAIKRVFSSTLIASIIPGASLKELAEWQLLLGVIALPGVFLGAYLIRYIGSRWLLILGFSGYLLIGLIIGCAFDKIIAIAPLFVILYGLLASFGNLGPGNVCGLVAAESYPSALRGTFYGFSAAVGKTGAALGTQAFRPIQDHLGKRYTFIVAAACGVVGVLLAFFFVPDTTKLDLAVEDELWNQYLRDNGWEGEMGDGSLPLEGSEEKGKM